MKNKSKHNKRIAISIISIISMLTFSLSNSMFIREANSEIEFASNISNEYDSKLSRPTGVSKYNIVRNYLGANEVSYKVEYAEDGVWYWNQQKSDYVKKSWTKYASNQWYYGPKISLGGPGDDQWHSGQSSYAPTFQIKYTGDRPTDTIYHPAIEDNPDTIYVDESKPAWEEEVPADWPNPSTAFKDSTYGWNQYTSWNPNSNVSYTYKWNNYNSKMGDFPKLKKDWTYVSKDSGQWNQSTYDHWDWSGSDYWKYPKRAETGEANKRVYIDWAISTNDVIIDEGTKDIFTNDVITQTNASFANSNPKASYSSTDTQRHSSSAPYVEIPEPNQSDWFGVSGETYINIDNLPLGWEYKFEADLKYQDKNGNEVIYDSYEDIFATEKSFDGDITTWHKTNSENQITFGYDIYDPKNLRATDVYWTYTTTDGDSQEGFSQSNHFEKTFYINEGEEAEFNVYYNYSLSNDIYGKPNLKKSYVATETGRPGVFYTNEIETFEVWIDNIQDDSFVFNYYLATNNNIIDEDAKIKIYNAINVYSISDVTLGTHSYLIDLASHPELDDISTTEYTAELEVPGLETETIKFDINTQTNLVKDFSMQLIDNSYIKNTEAEIEYVIDFSNLKEDVNSIQYNLNDKWYDLEYEETSSVQTLELNNLRQNTVYNIYFKANTDTRDYYSNNFKFKTDRNTKIYIEDDYSTVGENSASFTFNVDKYDYLDETRFKWDIIDLNDDKVLYERVDEIQGNGYKTVFADGLKANHKYRFVINAIVEDEVVMYYRDITTNLEEVDKLNNSYLNSINKTKNGFELGYEGKISSVQYSVNGEDWIDTNFDVTESKITVNGLEPNDEGYISFRVNNQMRSQITYYVGVESTMIKPDHKIDSNKLVFWILIIFIILTAIISTTWGVWYVKRHKKDVTIEGNIWRP